MAINFNQTSDLMMMELINQDNNQTLTLAVVQLSAPAPATGSRNSTVTLSARPASGYVGVVPFFYDRLDLAQFFVGGLDFEATGVTTTADLLPLINAQYNLQMRETDIILEPIEDGEVSLRAAPGSYLWIGEVDVVVTNPMIELEEILTVTELDGFEYPLP